MPAFDTPGPIAITVDVPSGDITVVASDRTDTVVEVRPADATKKEDIRAAERAEVTFIAGNLAVKMPKDWRTYTPFGGTSSIVVTIKAPTGSQLKATTSLGRLRGVGGLGYCELELVAGDVVVGRPLGSVTAKTLKGDIRIGAASRGELRLETSMGELEVGIAPGSAARVETNTQYGDVQNLIQPVDQPRGSEDTVYVYAHNSYGNIIVRHTTAA